MKTPFSTAYARTFASLGWLAFGATTLAQTLEFEGGADEFKTNFTVANGLEQSARYLPSIGVGGGGGFRVFNTQNLIYTGEKNQIPQLLPGRKVIMSVYFQRSGEAIPGSGARVFGMGLTTDEAPVDSSGSGGIGTAMPGQGNFGFVIKSNGPTEGGVTPMRIQAVDSSNGGEPVAGESFATFALPDEVWVKVEMSFTKTSSTGVWQGSIKVENYGADGIELVEALAEHTDLDFGGEGATQGYADETLFATFGTHASLAAVLDNFALLGK